MPAGLAGRVTMRPVLFAAVVAVALVASQAASAAPLIGIAFAAVGFTGTAASISASVIGAGLMFGLQMLLNKPKKPESSPQQYSVKQAMPARTRIYGQCQLGGAFACYEDLAGNRYNALVHCEGPIANFRVWRLDNTDLQILPDTLGGFANTPPWGNYVALESFRGTPGQAAAGSLQVLPYWTLEHVGNGLAYTVKVCTSPPARIVQKVFPTGEPQLRVIVHGPKLYDPRDPAQDPDDYFWNPTTWRYLTPGGFAVGMNSGLCILDYLRSPRGFGFANDLIDFASFSAFANLCDQAVPKKAGGTVPRYQTAGAYTLDEMRVDVLRRLLVACDGDLYVNASSKIAIRGGQWEAPAVTISGDHIRAIRFEGGSEKISACNQLKFLYTPLQQDYQTIPGDPWDDTVSQDLTGQVLSDEYDVRMTPDHGQGRRLSKIEMHKRSPALRLHLETDAAGLLAWGERTVRITHPTFTWPGLEGPGGVGLDASFLIMDHRIADDWTGCEIDLVSFTAAAYAWNAATEEGTEPVEPQTKTLDQTITDTPADLDVLAVRSEVTAGVSQVDVEMRCAPPVRQDLSLIGRIRGLGEPDWRPMVGRLQVDPDNPYSVEAGRTYVSFGPLIDGGLYELEGALESGGGAQQGPWVAAGTIMAVADVVAPGAPAFSATGTAGGADYSLTAANSANQWAVKVYKANGAGAAFSSATLLTTIYLAANAATAGQLTLPAGAYTLWARGANRSGFGDASSTSAPVNVTVT